MSFRDFGIIELTVFAVLVAAFLMFFILFIILRHRKQAANNRKLLKKRAMMEEAVHNKVRATREKVARTDLGGEVTACPQEYETFAPQERGRVQTVSGGSMQTTFAEEFAEETNFEEHIAQSCGPAKETFTGSQNVKKQEQQEQLRMWDNSSKSIRMAKRSQQDTPFFVEERRISHRRDQLKRMEEAK